MGEVRVSVESGKGLGGAESRNARSGLGDVTLVSSKNTASYSTTQISKQKKRLDKLTKTSHFQAHALASSPRNNQT